MFLSILVHEILYFVTGRNSGGRSVRWVLGGPFPGGKARPGRGADNSPPCSAEVEKIQELHLLSS
jgi:hypothetical protein